MIWLPADEITINCEQAEFWLNVSSWGFGNVSLVTAHLPSTDEDLGYILNTTQDD